MTVESHSAAMPEPIDLKAIYRRIRRYRWWIVSSVLMTTVLGALAALLVTPTYRAQVSLMPASTSSGLGNSSGALEALGGLAAVAGIGFGGTDTLTEEALAVLGSREFSERFIADEGLLPELFADKWDPERKAWKVDGGHQPTLFKAWKRFDSSIRKIGRDQKTGVIRLQITWRDRVEAARWANLLVDRVNSEMRARAVAETTTNLSYLEAEMDRSALLETRNAISRLIETQVQQRMLANVSAQYAFRIVDKALPPDEDSPIYPRALFVIAGIAFGLLIGLALAIFDWR